MPEQPKFSVYQFFNDESWECVRRCVEAKEAFEVAMRYTTSVGAKLGTTRRVIITDSGDCINFEWQFEKGIIYPLREEVEAELGGRHHA